MDSSSATTTLYVVRHGETEWNRQGRAQGHLDSPLSETGRTQAQYLADGLVGKGIDFIVSSDLGRALDTCRAIAGRLNLPYETDAGFRERHLGIMQGLTQQEFKDRHSEAYAIYKDPTKDEPIPGGESSQQHLDRSVAATLPYLEQHRGKSILVVCHGGVLDCFFYHTLGLKPHSERRFSIMNASINRFEVSDHGWKLITWGDVSHMHAIRTLDELQ